MPKTETADGEGLDGVQGHEGRERTAPDDAADPGGGADPEVETPRWRLSNWPLRYKLAVVMIIPLITALAFGSLRAVSELNEAAELNETVAQLEIAQQVTAVVQELQHERTMMVTSMSSGSIDDHAIQQQVERVNTAVKRLREFASTRDVGDEATQAIYDRALQRLDALDPLRAKIQNTALPDLSVLSIYNSIIDPLVNLGRTVNLSVTDRELLRQGTTVQALTEAKEFTAQQNAILQIAVGNDGFVADLMNRSLAAQASADAAVDMFNANATLSEQQRYLDTVAGAEIDNRQRLIATAYANADDVTGLNVSARQLTGDGAAAVNMIRDVEGSLLDQLRFDAGVLADKANRAAWVFFGLMIGTLIAAIGLTLVVARVLTGPLRTLRSSALEVAYVRLPETVRRILADPNPMEASRDAVTPVPVHTREEIGEVARSFDVVHERAIRLAAEQALLRENVNGIFVNLSRRSQRLVERQLGIIDRLESDEQDPDQLASLFELDHLATRLRRNGESLLVLSGAGLTKTMSKPVPAADVVGAAVSEIEQYARVELGTIPEVAVHGRAVHDLVHLLAELLDNATYFSEPETKISVRAVVTRRASLAVQITDRGVGMSDDQLAEANERLADPPDLDVSVTRRMGLYVVARLAKRHGIEVRLRENEDIEGGVIARVVVPSELLTGASSGIGAHPPIAPVERRSETSLPSTPPPAELPPAPTGAVPPLPAPRKPSPASERDPAPPPAPPPPTPPPAAPPSGVQGAADGQGLRPLDQPISLDDLVGGVGKAAGPFWTPAPPEPEPEPEPAPSASIPEPEEPQWPVASPDEGPDDARDEVQTSTTLPKREPRSASADPDLLPDTISVAGDGNALEDDVPTRRLPIYQSVLSRWFSEEPTAEPEVDAAAEAWGAAPGAVADTEPETGSADDAGDDMNGVSRPTGRDSTAGHVEPVVGDDLGWSSASDTGWQAAHALLEDRNEETTHAGLPKRVPNAYLVPGSITPGRGDAFTDKTVGEPGRSAVARSAEAARNRMMSFQRGYQSGRHALAEPSAQSEQFDETGTDSRHNGAKE